MTLREALIQSAHEIQRRLKEHRHLLDQAVCQETQCSSLNVCLISNCPHKRKLKEVLIETIEALERTRSAFKSKQLEQLRRKLTRLLAKCG